MYANVYETCMWTFFTLLYHACELHHLDRINCQQLLICFPSYPVVCCCHTKVFESIVDIQKAIYNVSEARNLVGKLEKLSHLLLKSKQTLVHG